MKNLTVHERDFSTWLGFKVQPSPEYPDRMFRATSKGVTVLEVCFEDFFWIAGIQVENFVGQALAMNRAEARTRAERKLLEAMIVDPKGMTWIRALNLFVVVNPDLITGDPTCQTLN